MLREAFYKWSNTIQYNTIQYDYNRPTIIKARISSQLLVIILHWRIFVKNIGGSTKLLLQPVARTDETICVSQLLRARAPAAPSLRRCHYYYPQCIFFFPVSQPTEHRCQATVQIVQ